MEKQKMKLTESRIKQIILEELESLLDEQEQSTMPAGDQTDEPPQKLQTDVTNVMKFMPKIDNVKEYAELVSLIVNHDFGNENQKKVVLKKLRDTIIQLMK